MTEYVSLRASQILGQDELVSFLKTQFPHKTKFIGRVGVEGTECVEVRIPSNSHEFEEIFRFIDERRKQGQRSYSVFTIGKYLRKYTEVELQNAEVLLLKIASHFEPSGEECGTIYETLCSHCNWGHQLSDLILDLRRLPQQKDISQTIAWVVWVVSSNFVRMCTENKLSGAEFCPIFEFKNPSKQSKDWHQLRVIGTVGELAEPTRLGRDPFSPSQIDWRCPLGHSVVTAFLSETYFRRSAWDRSDIAVTSSLFGQGRNLLRPAPLIIISQRMYRALQEAGPKGYSVEVAHLV
jgi:hypothetical protein